MAANTKIELKRKRIVLAYLEYCGRHYGENIALVSIPRHKLPIMVEVSELSLTQLMINHIEKEVYALHGLKNGDPVLISLYDNMFNSNRGKLSQNGHEFIQEMMVEAVTEALKNPKQSDLQVVS